MYKNVAGQKIAVFAWDTDNETEKTGDAGNITAQISKDGGATAATDDTNPTELDATDAPGIYIFDMTQAETNADMIILFAKSSTSNIKIEPVTIYTREQLNISSGIVEANVKQVSDDSTAADNLELDYDGTGYDKSASTIGTVSNVSDKSGYSISGDKNTLDDLNDVSSADVNSEVDTALNDIGLGWLFASDMADVNNATAGSFADLITNKDGSRTYDRSTDSLEAQTDILGSLNDISSADVNSACDTAITDNLNISGGIVESNVQQLAEDALTAIWGKQMADLAQGAPAADASVLDAINWLYAEWRNKTTTTDSVHKIYRDNGTTELAKANINDDGTTFTKSEFVSGA